MGKLIVLGVVFIAAVMGGTLYWTFKHHNDFTQTVTTKLKDEFAGYATRIEGSQKLQVAEISQVEVFERTSSLSLFWEQVKLPNVVISISAPVTFSYFVDLKKTWTFELQNDKLVAIVPSLEANIPAADLSATKFEVKQGSIFRNERAVLQGLQSQVTGLLKERALTNRALILETARKQVSDFLKTWLKTEFAKEKNFDVSVLFQDEVAQNSPPAPL
jgi:hypothetical protein